MDLRQRPGWRHVASGRRGPAQSEPAQNLVASHADDAPTNIVVKPCVHIFQTETPKARFTAEYAKSDQNQ